MDLYGFQRTVDNVAVVIRVIALWAVFMVVLAAMGPSTIEVNYTPDSKQAATYQRVTEGMAGWDCMVMGNHICGHGPHR